MTAASVTPSSTGSGDPRWFVPLVVWRVFTAVLLAAALVGVAIQRGIVLDGPVRWSLLVALLGAVIGSGLAIRGTLQRVHLGRLSGFMIDFLMAVVLGFIALNRMEMFTGIDAVGEAFNGNVAWLAIVILGWFVSGLADKAGPSQKVLKQVARWTMIAGVVVLTLAMGLIPGLAEFGQAARPGRRHRFCGRCSGGGCLRQNPVVGSTQHSSSRPPRPRARSMDGMLFVAPNVTGIPRLLRRSARRSRCSSASPSGTD